MARAPTDTIRFLTLDELGRLLAATRASARDRALFLLAYRHGLRASEVGLLRAEDLDDPVAIASSYTAAGAAAGGGCLFAGLQALPIAKAATSNTCSRRGERRILAIGCAPKDQPEHPEVKAMRTVCVARRPRGGSADGRCAA